MSFIERAIQVARGKTTKRVSDPHRTAAPRHSSVLPRPTHASPGEVIAFPRHGSGGSLVTEVANRAVYEQFRRLKRPLLQCAFGPLAGPGAQIIMVTSPFQGAGKTFISSNLSYALALEKDRNVLLIDTDNMNPSLTRELGLTNRPGLYDLISQPDLTLEQAVFSTDVPGLWVLPAGNPAADALELLNSARSHELFGRLMSRDPNTIVILDAPPLLMTTESPAVAALAGQFLLVVEAGVTPKSCITKSLEMLDEKQPVGLVLNKAKARGNPNFYYPYSYPA